MDHSALLTVMRPRPPHLQAGRLSGRARQVLFRRFSPPSKGCSSGVSASSRLCFQRVNPRSAPRGHARRPGAPHGGHYHQPIAMTEPPSQRSGFGQEPARHTEPDAPGAGDRIGSLRGASVEFDRHRAGQVIVGVVVCTLVVLIVVFTVAGVHSNSQTDELHEHGVPVTVTVTGCLGLLGGSGRNAAGYPSHGTYVRDGRRRPVALPGPSFPRPGSTIPSLAVPDDPALVSPDSVIDNQHSSAGVFVLPAV